MGHLLNIGILARRSELKDPAGRARTLPPRPAPGTVSPVPPTLGPAVALALRAVWREGWLLAPGFLVTALRRALGWPALAFAWGIAVEAALQAARGAPLDPLAPASGVAAAFTAPRVLAVAGGLWLAGAVGGALLRVAWLSGALPALGGALAGGQGGAACFAAGVAYGFPRVLAAALLGLLVEASGALFAVALALGALQITGAVAGGGAPPLLAAAVAAALTVAVAVPVALSAAVDAALARAALRGEGPVRAFAGATRRILARPGSFMLGALAFGLLGALAPVSVETLGSAVTGFAAGAPAWVMLGPTLLLTALAGVAATALDLAWLGTVSVLACADERAVRRLS